MSDEATETQPEAWADGIDIATGSGVAGNDIVSGIALTGTTQNGGAAFGELVPGISGLVYIDANAKNPEAVMFDQLTYDEYLARDLKVADATGIAMARDNNMDMVFFNLSTPGTIGRAVRGEKIGTLVGSGA